MSRLVAQIVLTILLIPMAFVLYFIAYGASESFFIPYGQYRSQIFAGVLTWTFVVGYWIFLWQKTTHWTRRRKKWTTIAAIASILIALLVGLLLGWLDRYSPEFGIISACFIGPLTWIVWSTLLWQESLAERAKRMAKDHRVDVICPNCGYNLKGLQGTCCPECGTLYTLNEIIAAQPARADADIGE